MSKQIRLFALRVQVKLNSQFKSKTATLLDNFAPAQHSKKLIVVSVGQVNDYYLSEILKSISSALVNY